jgi:hypothetical protein
MRFSAFLVASLARTAFGACEIDCKPVVACNDLQMDVIFALDDSGSLSARDWENQKEFVKLLATGMDEKFGGTRMGLVQWGGSVANKAKDGTDYTFPLPPSAGVAYDRCLQPWKVDSPPAGGKSAFVRFKEVLEGMVHLGGGTPTEDAFRTCATEFGRTRRMDAQGNEVQQLCIVVTDGSPNEKKVADAAAVTLKQTDGIILLMVGVGNINKAQLVLWASEPKDLYNHLASDYTKVITETLPNIISSVCFYVEPFEKACAQPTQAITVKGSGFVASTGGTLTCVFSKGVRTLTTTATKKSITEVTCPVPAFQNDENLPNYFPEDLYILELSRDTGTTSSTNNNPIYLYNDCSTLPTADPGGFNPFVDGDAGDGEADGMVDGGAPDGSAASRDDGNTDLASSSSKAAITALALFAPALALLVTLL